jgi:hypothetical protein
MLIVNLAQEHAGEAGYQLVAARLLLREGDRLGARRFLEAALCCKLSQNERAQVRLLLGFACDLQGDRSGALACYRRVQEAAAEAGQHYLKRLNPFVLAEAVTHTGTPFNARDAAKIEVNPMMSTLHDM